MSKPMEENLFAALGLEAAGGRMREAYFGVKPPARVAFTAWPPELSPKRLPNRLTRIQSSLQNRCNLSELPDENSAL